MLVCPHCRFENPNTNKFCQECGASLTQNTCLDCGRMVPFEAVHCPTCGAISGMTWLAIITGSLERALEPGPELPSIPTAGGDVESALASDPTSRATSTTNGSAPAVYLDLQHRYQLLEPMPAVDEQTHEQQVRVLDCNPFQLSPLAALVQPEADVPAAFSPAAASSEERVDRGASLGLGVSSVSAIVIPTMAQPYLALGEQFYQTLPILHDAWQQDGQQILLIEDRSEWPLLLDLWLDAEMSLPPLQMLHWLYEIVELWRALEPWHCLESLLEIENLRVDEDQALCLQRLYLDSAVTPTLQDLGRLWQTLFAQSQRTHFGGISLLLADLEANKVDSIESLKSRVEAIAYELQVSQLETDDVIDQPMTAPPIEMQAPTTTPASTRLEVPSYRLGSPGDDEIENDTDPTIVLPMQLSNLEDLGWTDIGRERQHNEDFFGIETQVVKLESPAGRTLHVRNLYILCDGMGGQADGEIASALAVDTLRRYFKEHWLNDPVPDGISNKLPGPDVLNEAVQLANKAIYDINQQNARSGSGRMGTTLVMLLIQDTDVAIAHVGDSRLYRYTRKRGLEQLTVDHEVGQREIQRGVEPEIAYARPDAYQLTQALGPRDEHFVKPDIQYLELNEDTLIFLCSDGLTDNDLLETHLQTHIEPLISSQSHLEQGVGKLIELANQYNGHDNITAVVIRAKVRPNLEHLK